MNMSESLSPAAAGSIFDLVYSDDADLTWTESGAGVHSVLETSPSEFLVDADCSQQFDGLAISQQSRQAGSSAGALSYILYFTCLSQFLLVEKMSRVVTFSATKNRRDF